MNLLQEFKENQLEYLSDSLFKRHLIDKSFTIKKSELSNLDFAKHLRFIQLEKFVYEKNAKIHLKLRSVYSALHSLQVKLIFKVVSDGDTCEILLGIKSEKNVSDASKVLRGSLEGNFPGTTISNETELKNDEAEKINRKAIKDAKEVTVVLGIPSVKKEDEEEFIQGIENLIFGMQGKAFTALFIAIPIKHDDVLVAIDVYEKVYSVLSHFQERVENQGISNSISDSEGTSVTFSETDSEGTSNTKTYSTGTNESKTTSSSPWLLKKFANGIGGTGSELSKSTDKWADLLNKKLKKEYFKKTADGSRSTGTSKNESDSTTKNSNTSKTRADGVQKNRALTEGQNESIQLTSTNKKVVNFLEKLEKQIERLESGKGQGFWNVGAYFLSKEHQNSVIAANIYSGVIKGETSNIEPNAVETFNATNGDSLSNIKSYLSNYEIPQINTNQNDEGFLANAVNTNELTIQISLPNKSVPGLDVVEVAPFGSNLKKVESNKRIEIGNLFNYDKKYKLPVFLDSNKFTSHVFITGSTGSGKSNVTYNLLENLYKKEIKFLVIEPAKGEYKDIFGNRENVSVFGTNPRLNHLLKINPFAFPEEIHVYEHIDRFIEILNACWPMEAAMPAVLKDAIEQTYISVGWDMINSKNIISDRDFPTFQDLLKVLPDVISNSGYSQEIKSNYEGALVTRVKSLTNGLLSLIFGKDELSDEVLFDNNVIADLSRVPSSETKALLMGIIFMKLNEYRVSSRSGNNSDLKHVTVLEEAHNLLKRTSSEQSSSSANLQGKSVEMISNAIAEMRTYGEGFILADQAPGLMDMAAIRNTNTKICLRLPDFDDRELVGKAMNLSEQQIEELASLDTGVAAVYQNDWQESILCKFNLFENKDLNYAYSITKPEREFQLALARYIFDDDFNKGKTIEEVVNLYQNEPYYKNYRSIIRNLDDENIASGFVFETLNLKNVWQYTIYNTPKNIEGSRFKREFKKNLVNTLREHYPIESILKIYNKVKNSVDHGI